MTETFYKLDDGEKPKQVKSAVVIGGQCESSDMFALRRLCVLFLLLSCSGQFLSQFDKLLLQQLDGLV